MNLHLEEIETGEGPYTCRSCCQGTWNDDDLCDYCAQCGTSPDQSKDEEMVESL